MYSAVLLLHSYVRWVVLLLGVLAVVRIWSGRLGGRAWTSADGRAVQWFSSALGLQVLLGLLLYVALSPMTRAAFSDFGAAMGDRVLRFWAVEHIFGMIAAIALLHIGQGRARRAGSDAGRFRTLSVFLGLALLLILVSIPWPWMAIGRPLFRF